MSRKGDSMKRRMSSSDRGQFDNNARDRREGEEEPTNEQIALDPLLRRTRSRMELGSPSGLVSAWLSSLPSSASGEQARSAKSRLEADIWRTRPNAQFAASISVPAAIINVPEQGTGHSPLTDSASIQLLQPTSVSPFSNPPRPDIPTNMGIPVPPSNENVSPATIGPRKSSRLRTTISLGQEYAEFITPPPEEEFNPGAVADTESDAYSEASTSARPQRSRGTATIRKVSASTALSKRLETLKVDAKKGSDSLKATPKSKWTSESMNELPPISSIHDIFEDITKRNEKLKDVAVHLNGRPLRIATMCSGTESPLLALDLIISNMKSLFGVEMRIQHVFSCEIEPWKQAYIERNFRPPILFRDVCELGEEYATTAYGAKVKVPGNCDILVAGTSCVDYSSLNNFGKGLNDGGESGRTFWGMFGWVTKHRPKIVILENVCKAPWGQVVAEFENIGYAAGHTKFDTKNYYIPHTRQRGYLVAFDAKDGVMLPGQWTQMVNDLTRPASVSFESFLLESDDPRVLEARQKLIREDGGKGKSHDWTACEIRHTNARTGENLGRGRPFTGWQENGMTKYPDFTWQEWGDLQVDRVNDLLDISYLRNVKKGIDVSFKARLWNLSQNVDRDTEGKSAGISQCLTPTMIPYLTARGGPVIGIELLSLQGLPVKQLILTRETEANLKDLAGNAMSSTVVGTAIVAALITGKDILHRGHGKLDLPFIVTEKSATEKPLMVVPQQLSLQELDLGSAKQLRIKDLIKAAARSARMCVCEGRSLVAQTVQKCQECDHPSCTKCAGKPQHVNTPQNITRIPPFKFESHLKNLLPMLVKFKHGKGAIVAAIQQAESLQIKNKDWSFWQSHVIAALSSTFMFKCMKRQEIWVVEYESSYGRLELLLDPAQIEWRVFAKVGFKKNEWKELRRTFATPVAQLLVAKSGMSLLEGSWRIGVPGIAHVDVSVEGVGALVDSWEKSVGITEASLADKMVHSTLNIQLCDARHAPILDVDITGTWELLPKCGTANRALHRKRGEKESLYLFLDPNRLGDTQDDRFVISKNCRRLAFGEARLKIASFDSLFRPSADEPKVLTQLTVETFWVSAGPLRLKPSGGKKASFSFSNPQSIAAHLDCAIPVVFLTSSAPLAPALSSSWDKQWQVVDEAQAEETFSSITWLVDQMKSNRTAEDWTAYEIEGLDMNCATCAPPKPSISWRAARDKFGAIEDPEESAVWERAMKARPTPWVTVLKSDNRNTLHLQVGLNLMSLVHRAADLLPQIAGLGELSIDWRLVTEYVNPPRLVLPQFNIRSNKQDIEAPQPPGFILSLRPEQLRSLTWMMNQESPTAGDFVEEEIVEALHTQLSWKADVKASRPSGARGGVLADAVGYGKTAIILGLLAHMKNVYIPPADTQGRIPLKATLIIVPGHLSNQWESEIRKFTGGLFKVVNIKTMTQMNSCSLKSLMAADIIIVAGSLFKSVAYLQRLAEFSGGATCPATGGRRFQDWLKDVTGNIRSQVQRLYAGDVSGITDSITKGCQKREKARLAEEGIPFLGRKAQNRAGSSRKKMAVESPETSDLEAYEDEPIKKRKPKASENKEPSTYEGRRWKISCRKGDWDATDLLCPPLELFFFNRLVLDEFTYIGGMPLEAIANLSATYRWVLSGTPPIGDFADVKKIARFLGIMLGVDDDTANSVLNNKAISKDRTAVEAFQAFKEVRTAAWHLDRHRHAQKFLVKFMRQNVAEIDEIPWEEHFVKVQLPATERAIYIELDHHLKAMEMIVTKRSVTRGGGDREARLHSAISSSSSAEEALLKSGCHFSLNLENLASDATARTACDTVIADRFRQLEGNVKELTASLRDGLLLARRWEHPTIPKSDLQYTKYLEEKRKSPLDDDQATALFRKLLQQAKDWAAEHEKKPTVPSILSSLRAPRLGLAGEGADEDEDEDEPAKPAKTAGVDVAGLLKTIQFQTSRLLKELVGRCRSLRFIKVVREVQTLRGATRSTAVLREGEERCGCGKELVVEDVTVSSICGHVACTQCMARAASLHNECPAKLAGCLARILDVSLVPATSLGAENDMPTTYGAKMDALVRLLKSRIPAEERVLLFVQFPDLLKKVEEVLNSAGVSVTRLAGSSLAKTADLTVFQTEKSSRVLLLEVMGETAAGANLTVANHIIFLCPLLAASEQLYAAAETQAIGRARRYGQKKTVFIWRLVANETIDYDLYLQRGNPVH
ncbi:hypothetical protein TWF694_006963 [Orbilia ellipsospora]|uniref:Helicase ATP-binding domain-containing protein n=1 Tax=Orbilia ellipsospora TaxID=2528407 RepID=A0AAV9XTG4_9PEZI